jgi:RNA polymerase sigma-70 factor (ECF subfamily)
MPTDPFTITHWSVVLRAGLDDTAARNALSALCASYWSPVYCFIRGRGYNRQDAEDFTQGFFARMIARDGFRKATPERGKFRSFLLTALKNFLADQHDRNTADKRGGGQKIVSFDGADAEAKYRRAAVDHQTPDKLFDKRWALALIDASLQRLRREFVDAGKTNEFSELRHFIVAGAEPRTFAEVAIRLDISEEAVKKAVQRLRRRYTQIVREDVRQTLGNDAEIEEELRYLMSCLSI